MDDRQFGLRVLELDATEARSFKRLSMKGYGIAVLEAPAAAAAVLHIGGQDGDGYPLVAGATLRSPVPFGDLWISNAAAASGSIKFVVATEPGSDVYLAGVGDITMGGVTPAMGRDDTDDQAAVSSGLLKVASRSYLWDPEGGDWDRARVDHWEEVFALANRTTTPSFVSVDRRGARALVFYLDVQTNAGGAQTVAINVRAEPSGGWQARTIHAMTPSALGGIAGVMSLSLGQGATNAWTGSSNPHEAKELVVPPNVGVRVDHSGAGTWGYRMKVGRVY